MQFVENAIDFFEKIDDLTRCLDEMKFQNEDDREYDFSFIAEPVTLDNGYTVIVSYVFNLINEEEKGNEDEDEEKLRILSYSNLVKLSKDNKKYYVMSEEFDKLIGSLVNGYKTENFKLYICDITETFYTEINDDNKAYFFLRIFDEITLEKKVSENYGVDVISQTFYYEWDYAFFKSCDLDEYFDIDEINEFTVINLRTVEKDGYEETEWAKRPLNLKDIWREYDFEDHNGIQYGKIEYPFVVKMKNRHKELLNSLKKDELNLFGKTYAVDKSYLFSDKMNILVSFVCAFNQGFDIGMTFAEQIKYYIATDESYTVSDNKKTFFSRYFKEITEIWYGENLKKEFDIENVQMNTATIMQKYVMISATHTLYTSDTLKLNPNTYFLYNGFNPDKVNISHTFFDFSTEETSIKTALSLPSIKYIFEYIHELEEFYGQVMQAQDDIENFDLGLAGGGFGIGGAIKGMLTASFLNAATKTAYSAYKATKLKPKEQEARLEEFTKSPKTKAYICELIIIDMKLMFVSHWDKLYNIIARVSDSLIKSEADIEAQKRKEFLYRALGVHNLKGLLDSYTKSYKLYSIALAKYLNLLVMPVYEDMEQYYDMSPLELIENAILEFPYDGSYYQKYKEFGGEITDDLKTFATLHMNDVDDLFLYTKFENSIGKSQQYFDIYSTEGKIEFITEFVKNNLGKTEEDTRICREKVDEYAKKYGIEQKDLTKAYSIIENHVKKLDENYRTVDSILFPSREETDAARSEFEKIKEIMSEVKPPEATSTLEYEKNLTAIKCNLEGFNTDVKAKYIEEIDSNLKEFGTLYISTNAFGKSLSQPITREEKGNLLAHKYVSELKITTYDELNEARAKLIEYLPKVNLEATQAVLANDYLNKCEQILNTVDGITFSTKEEADHGRKELADITEIMSNVQPPNSNSLLSYERNLFEVKNKLQAFTTPIKEKYISTVDRHLTRFDELFRQIGTFSKAATREEAAQNKAYNYVRTWIGSELTYDKVDSTREKLNEYLPEIGIELSQALQAVQYLDQCETTLNTVDGVAFATRDEAALGINELSKITEIMSNVQPPNRDSLLSYEKKLLDVKENLQDFTTPIKNKYIGIIDGYLTKFNELFRRTGTFSKVETMEEAAQVKAYNFVKKAIGTNLTYDNLDKTREKLNEYLPEFGIDLAQAGQAVQYLEQCEVKLNTVDGVAFGSREEAALAREELPKITEIMKSVQQPNRDSLLSYEKKLFAVKEKLELFTSPVKEKYIGTINSYLVKFDDLFKQMGFSKAITREEAAQYKALKLVKNLAGANATYTNVDNAKVELEKLLPEIGISIQQALSATQYIQSVEDRLNTVDGVVFNTREDAEEGRKEFESIKGLMHGVTPPTNNSLLDYEKYILDIKSKVEEFHTEVKNKYVNLLQQYLTGFDEKFRRISIVKVAATREEAARDKALKFVKSRTYNTLNDIEYARNELVALLPKLGIEMEQAVEASDYLASVKSKLEDGGKSGGFMKLFKK